MRAGEMFDHWLNSTIFYKVPGSDTNLHKFVYGSIFHGDADCTENDELADVSTGVLLVAVSSRVPFLATLLRGWFDEGEESQWVRTTNTDKLSVARWVPGTNVDGLSSGFNLTDLVESGNRRIAQGLLECIKHYGRVNSGSSTDSWRRHLVCSEQVRRTCQVMHTEQQRNLNVLVRSYDPVMSWCKYLEVQPNGSAHHPFIKALCEPTRLLEMNSIWSDHGVQTRSVVEMLRIFCQETVNVGVRSLRRPVSFTCPRLGVLMHTNKKHGKRRPVSSTIFFFFRAAQLDATQCLPSGPLKNRGILVCRESAVGHTGPSLLDVGKVCVILSEGSHIGSQECKITPPITALMDAQGQEREVDSDTEVLTFLLPDLHMEHFTHEAFRRDPWPI